ncbi:hypothetical protein EVAR_61231_1 [Eumeta japonica]|uniref:Uncharacterized protein n=1 Tax=Eumeta variegata TaxID=151549 RepID=A0A4C1ZAH3_EUMVA|nr:hypothetical protein EVAR_61231_1 [Eumeta japonica]
MLSKEQPRKGLHGNAPAINCDLVTPGAAAFGEKQKASVDALYVSLYDSEEQGGPTFNENCPSLKLYLIDFLYQFRDTANGDRMDEGCKGSSRKTIKDVLRLYGSRISKMRVCGSFTADAGLPLRLVALITAYCIVLLQHAFSLCIKRTFRSRCITDMITPVMPLYYRTCHGRAPSHSDPILASCL